MKNLLLITLLSLATLSFGQKSNQFSFSVGSAIPLANFQKTDINTISSGYAENGRNLQIKYARDIAKLLSIQFTIMDVVNKMDNQPELQLYTNTTSTTNNVSIQNRAWNSTSILVGVSKRVQILESKFSIEPTINAGYSRVKRPDLFVSNHIDDPFIAQSESESTSSTLSILLGLNNHYKVNDQFSFFIALEYFSTSPNFDFTRYPITAKNSNSSPQEISYTQDIRLFMINGGVSFSF